MRIVVDAMGGDHAPGEIVKGAVEAIATNQELEVILVGPAERVQLELNNIGYKGDRITIENATEVIEMGEHPGMAIRRKKDSSIVKGVKLVKEGKGDAFVSAGNTGACMAASLFSYGRIKGIDRPAIASALPSEQGPVLVLDVGANADCKSENLLQFGLMGQVYSERVLGIRSPRVGLLNIGEEEEKGSELTQATYQLMKNAKGLNFAGNIEGRDITTGNIDVVVCDGFVGNVVLKFAEGLSKSILTMIKNAIKATMVSSLGGLLIKDSMQGLKKKMDYTEYGGSPLLGINGITIISHGSSNAKAIKNAVRVAIECADQRVVQVIADSILANEA